MKEKKNNINTNETEEEENNGSFGDSIVSLLSHFISIPIFIVLHRLLPDPDWKFNLDRILLFVSTFTLVEMIFNSLRIIVILGFIGSLAWLIYGSFWGNYGFLSLYQDYKYMIYSMIDSPHPEEIIISKLKPFPNKSEIKKAIDYDNPEVRNFAILATKIHFQDYQEDKGFRTIIQCLAVFKEIKEGWNYVSDPKSREYFAKASESIIHLSGDCDDYSILMAACIKAIGGTPRLVHTSGHLYPEVLIGKKGDMERVNYLIKRKLFRDQKGSKKINYHIDEYGQAWLNLDYTAKYPGGRFMNEEILGTLILN
jgi:hypothetical protein